MHRRSKMYEQTNPSKVIVRLFAFFLLPIALLLAGCGAARPIKFYSLDLPTNSPANASAHDVNLLVGRVTAPHLLRDTRIVYRTGGTEKGAYEYHRWVEPPTDMLEALLLRALRASGKYRSVQPLRSNARGDFILRGRLHEFEEVSGSSLAARVVLEMDLFEASSGTTVWSHLYRRDESVEGKDVPTVVEAFNRNAQRALGEITAALDQHFTQHPPKR